MSQGKITEKQKEILEYIKETILGKANEESRSKAYNRYYTNIEIKEGDTLWSIASQYSKNSGMSIQEYIREIKAMNHKGSDRINAGDSLAIVYFREAGPKT